MYSAELQAYFLNVLGLKSRELSWLDVAIGSEGDKEFRYDIGDSLPSLWVDPDVSGGLQDTPLAHRAIL